jgi:type III restriction-modification system methylation subunit
MMTEGYSEPLTEKFLEDNPFLVLDTKFFSAEFKHKLVGSMEKVDEECNVFILIRLIILMVTILCIRIV